MTDEAYTTSLALLDFPDPEGLHPSEAKWREVARRLRAERDNWKRTAEEAHSRMVAARECLAVGKSTDIDWVLKAIRLAGEE